MYGHNSWCIIVPLIVLNGRLERILIEGVRVVERLPWWLRWGESACSAEDLGSSSGLERSPREGIPAFLPGRFLGQRSPMGYSPWGHKEPYTTERITLWSGGRGPC